MEHQLPVAIHFRSSINEVICHGIPDQRKLVEGDIINLGSSVTLIINAFSSGY